MMSVTVLPMLHFLAGGNILTHVCLLVIKLSKLWLDLKKKLGKFVGTFWSKEKWTRFQRLGLGWKHLMNNISNTVAGNGALLNAL